MSSRSMMSSSPLPPTTSPSPKNSRRRYKWHHILVSTLCLCALVGVVATMFTTINNIHNMKKKKRSLTDEREDLKRSISDVASSSEKGHSTLDAIHAESSINPDTDSAVKKHLLSAVQDDNMLLENPSLRLTKRSITSKEKRSINSDKTYPINTVEDDIFDDDDDEKPSTSAKNDSSITKRSKVTDKTSNIISATLSNDTDAPTNAGATSTSGNDQGSASFNVMEMNQSDQQQEQNMVNINEQPKNITTANKTIDEWTPGVARNTSTVEATLLAINSTRTGSNSTNADDVDDAFESGVGDSDAEDDGSGSNQDQVDSVDTVTAATAGDTETQADANLNNSNDHNSPASSNGGSTTTTTTVKQQQQQQVAPQTTAKKINSTSVVDEIESADSSASGEEDSDEDGEDDEMPQQAQNQQQQQSQQQQQKGQQQQQHLSKGKTQTTEATKANTTSSNIIKPVESNKNKVNNILTDVTNAGAQQGNINKLVLQTPLTSSKTQSATNQASLKQQQQQQTQSIATNNGKNVSPKVIKTVRGSPDTQTNTAPAANASQKPKTLSLTPKTNKITIKPQVNAAANPQLQKTDSTNKKAPKQATLLINGAPLKEPQAAQNTKMHLVAVKNAFHFANESKVLAQQQMNVTSSLYENGNSEAAGIEDPSKGDEKSEVSNTNEKTGMETSNALDAVESEDGETAGIKTAATANTLEGEVRNIDEDHKTDNPPPSSSSSTTTSGGSDDDKYPTFPNNYHATGIIILPESKIAEPFEIWYAPEYKKSRIDYYYGRSFLFSTSGPSNKPMADLEKFVGGVKLF